MNLKNPFKFTTFVLLVVIASGLWSFKLYFEDIDKANYNHALISVAYDMDSVKAERDFWKNKAYETQDVLFQLDSVFQIEKNMGFNCSLDLDALIEHAHRSGADVKSRNIYRVEGGREEIANQLYGEKGYVPPSYFVPLP